MAFDPFPNTTDATSEQRFKTLFDAVSALPVLSTDPIDLREGLLWVNRTTKEIRIVVDGEVWKIGLSSVL